MRRKKQGFIITLFFWAIVIGGVSVTIVSGLPFLIWDLIHKRAFNPRKK